MQSPPNSLIARLVAVAFFPLGCIANGADWPNFRGPNHDGIVTGETIRTTWNEPMPLLWERHIGSAFSSFACVGDRVFTGGTEDGKQTLLCLNADTGAVVWKKAFERTFQDGQGGNGPRATPTVHDGRVYFVGGHGALLCLDAATGNDVWTTQLNDAPYWGYSGSVLIDGDLAIVASGESDGSLVAFDKKSGKRVWSAGKDPTGYSTPYPFTFNGRRYIVGFTGNSAIIADARDGKIRWRTDWKTSYNVNAASPLYHNGHLLLTSGYGHGAILLKLEAEGDSLSAEPVWEGNQLRNKFQSCVLYQGHLYTSDEKSFKCVEFLTGRQKWERLRAKHGTVLLIDGQLLFLNEQGQLQIAPASPEGFSPTATAEILSGRCWTVPVLQRGRLYARNLERVVCFNLAP